MYLSLVKEHSRLSHLIQIIWTLRPQKWVYTICNENVKQGLGRPNDKPEQFTLEVCPTDRLNCVFLVLSAYLKRILEFCQAHFLIRLTNRKAKSGSITQ